LFALIRAVAVAGSVAIAFGLHLSSADWMPVATLIATAVEHHQVRQRDVHPRLHRLPGPLRQQPGRQEPLHGLLQPVVEPLRLAAGILRPGRSRQRIQHRPHHRGALRRQIPVQHPGAAERGLQPHRPVLERRVFVVVRGRGPGPGIDLPGQPGQVR